jgi:hypothetical protein
MSRVPANPAGGAQHHQPRALECRDPGAIGAGPQRHPRDPRQPRTADLAGVGDHVVLIARTVHVQVTRAIDRA